jgi:hypothetical protein
MAWIKEDLTGKSFTRLTVTSKLSRGSKWVCVCECGATTTVLACHLLSGNKKSCGCLKKSILGDATRKHGQANSRITGYANRTYGIWQAMRGRCTNPNNSRWEAYGGRGIKICKRWDNYENFLLDMGEAPKNLTLERVNVNGDYKPSNCKWATWAEQAKNKRKKNEQRR